MKRLTGRKLSAVRIAADLTLGCVLVALCEDVWRESWATETPIRLYGEGHFCGGDPSQSLLQVQWLCAFVLSDFFRLFLGVEFGVELGVEFGVEFVGVLGTLF